MTGVRISNRTVALMLSLGIVAVGAGLSTHFLFTKAGPLGLQSGNYVWWYPPSICFAAGHGLAGFQTGSCPGVDAFISGSTTRLDALPAIGANQLLPLTNDQAWHRYLLYAVGIVWRLFGVSWQSVKILSIVLYALMGLGLYAFLRLSLNRAFAFIAAALYLMLPQVLTMTANFRDLSKAPFFFAIIFLIGLLVTKKPGPKRFILYAFLIGILQGIGCGFREDVLSYSLPVLLAIAFSEMEWGQRFSIPRALAVRLAAAVVWTVALIICGLPILIAFHRFGSPSSYHVIVGTSRYYEDKLDIVQGSYERNYNCSDTIACYTAASYGRRVHGDYAEICESSPEMSAQRDRYVRDMVLQFPGDMFARWYRAVERCLGDGPQQGPAAYRFLARFGIVLASVVLLLISARNLRHGFLLFLMTVFFCGTISLEYDIRHAFHLAFIPIWCAFLLGNIAIEGIVRVVKFPRGRIYPEVSPRFLGMAVLRMVVTAVTAIAIIAGSLFLARAWQDRYWHRMAPVYRQAAKTPLEFDVVRLGKVSLFRLKGPAVEIPPEREQFRDAYLVVELDSSVPAMSLVYDNRPDDDDGCAGDVPVLCPRNPGETVQYFFPVYEMMENPGGSWRRFAGVAVAREFESGVKGLWRVSDPTPFPFFLNVSLPARDEQFAAHMTFPSAGEPADSRYPSTGGIRQEAYRTAMRAWGLRNERKLEDAESAYRAGLAIDPRNIQLMAGLALVRREQGDRQGSISALQSALTTAPDWHDFQREIEALSSVQR